VREKKEREEKSLVHSLATRLFLTIQEEAL
jgi:hypothetical protein